MGSERVQFDFEVQDKFRSLAPNAIAEICSIAGLEVKTVLGGELREPAYFFRLGGGYYPREMTRDEYVKKNAAVVYKKFKKAFKKWKNEK
jgi:hypothetical protein